MAGEREWAMGWPISPARLIPPGKAPDEISAGDDMDVLYHATSRDAITRRSSSPLPVKKIVKHRSDGSPLDVFSILWHNVLDG
jgi:hypothetical protein